MLARKVQPEILDSLPADDADAIASRKDLCRINALMGNFRWVQRQLDSFSDPLPVVELGAGEGRLLEQLGKRGHKVTGIDLAPRPPDLDPSVGWIQGNVLEAEIESGAAVVATLFLHHLEEEELRQLGRRLAQARVLVFSEPHRSRAWMMGGYGLFPFVNRITRHDMIVSIEAGFRSGELGPALGLDERWSVRESVGGLGSLRFVATGTP